MLDPVKLLQKLIENLELFQEIGKVLAWLIIAGFLLWSFHSCRQSYLESYNTPHFYTKQTSKCIKYKNENYLRCSTDPSGSILGYMLFGGWGAIAMSGSNNTKCVNDTRQVCDKYSYTEYQCVILHGERSCSVK